MLKWTGQAIRFASSNFRNEAPGTCWGDSGEIGDVLRFITLKSQEDFVEGPQAKKEPDICPQRTLSCDR